MGKKRTLSLMALLFWLILWQIVASLIDLPVLLPGPIDTFVTLFQLAKTRAFWLSLMTTLLRIGAGYLIALVLGALIAWVSAFSTVLAAFFRPIRTLVRSTPVSSIIILVLLWIKAPHVPVFIAALTVLPIVWQGVEEGIGETDKGLLQMAEAYSFTPMKCLLYLYLPSIRPYFYASCATGLGFAWKSGIAAEVIARPVHAIGSALQDAKVYLNTKELFAWTLAVVLLSLLLEIALKRLMGGGGKAH